jgi:hypothetical protein
MIVVVKRMSKRERRRLVLRRETVMVYAPSGWAGLIFGWLSSVGPLRASSIPANSIKQDCLEELRYLKSRVDPHLAFHLETVSLRNFKFF